MENEILNSFEKNLSNNLCNNLFIDNPSYPKYLNESIHIRPNLVIDLNGILIFSSHLIDARDITKYTSFNNFLLIYKDFDHNMSVIYYRNFIKEFLLEINNYYNIYIYSSINKTQTDFCVMMLVNLLGINVFKGIYLKHQNEPKSLENIHLNPLNTIIIDYNNTNWKLNERNLLLIPIFKGPNIQDYDKNTDLLNLKKCLCRIYKLFVDNLYGDICNYISECQT